MIFIQWIDGSIKQVEVLNKGQLYALRLRHIAAVWIVKPKPRTP